MKEITSPNPAYQQYLEQAFQELADAVQELLAPTYPTTPLPRPREFKIGRYVWPYVPEPGDVRWWTVYKGQHYYSLKNPWWGKPDAPVAALLEECKYQPARILRVAEQIRAAAEWCRKRAAGRRRHAEEILRQQRQAVEKIQTDLALNALQ